MVTKSNEKDIPVIFGMSLFHDVIGRSDVRTSLGGVEEDGGRDEEGRGGGGRGSHEVITAP